MPSSMMLTISVQKLFTERHEVLHAFYIVFLVALEDMSFNCSRDVSSLPINSLAKRMTVARLPFCILT